jgi:hypothetical protein
MFPVAEWLGGRIVPAAAGDSGGESRQHSQRRLTISTAKLSELPTRRARLQHSLNLRRQNWPGNMVNEP